MAEGFKSILTFLAKGITKDTPDADSIRDDSVERAFFERLEEGFLEMPKWGYLTEAEYMEDVSSDSSHPGSLDSDTLGFNTTGYSFQTAEVALYPETRERILGRRQLDSSAFRVRDYNNAKVEVEGSAVMKDMSIRPAREVKCKPEEMY